LHYRPKDREELFNLRHAKLRNAVERALGQKKRRFTILRSAAEYPYETQVKLPPALAALHNFIVMYDPDDGFEYDMDLRNDPAPFVEVEEDMGELAGEITPDNRERAVVFRNQIAQEMWDDYQHELRERELQE
jgi:hypothetical protein